MSSGLGGVYPPGYPVGKVTAVVRDPGQPLLAVEAEPLAGLDRDPEVLLVWFDNVVVEPEPEPTAKHSRADACRQAPARSARAGTRATPTARTAPAHAAGDASLPTRPRSRRTRRPHRHPLRAPAPQPEAAAETPPPGGTRMMRGTRTNFGWAASSRSRCVALTATVAAAAGAGSNCSGPIFVALTVLWFCLLSPRLLGLCSTPGAPGSRSTASAACCSASTR